MDFNPNANFRLIDVSQLPNIVYVVNKPECEYCGFATDELDEDGYCVNDTECHRRVAEEEAEELRLENEV